MTKTNNLKHHTPDYFGLSETDKALLNRSSESNDWSEVSDYKKKAESEQAKKIIHNRKIELYRKEESFANQL